MTRTHARDPATKPRFARYHAGRVVRLTLNRGFVEGVGPDLVDTYVDTLALIARDHTRSVTETAAALRDGWARGGVRVDDVSTGRLAELLADPKRVGLIVEDEDGQRLLGADCDLADLVDDDGYHEPQDPDRPFYS